MTFFKAAKQALTEALVLEQSETPQLNPAERDSQMAELQQVIDTISRSEIALFCALCTHQPSTAPAASSREFGSPAEDN